MDIRLEKFRQNGHLRIQDNGSDLWCESCGAKNGTPEQELICEKAEYVHVSVMNREIKLIMDNFGGVKSGKKIQKKIAKLYSKEMRNFAEEKTNELYKSFEEHIKPRAWWMPEWFYRWMGSKFVEGL